MKDRLSKVLATSILIVLIQPAGATDCSDITLLTTCRPDVSSTPSDTIWNPLLADQQLIKASVTKYLITAYVSILGALISGGNNDEGVNQDFGPGFGPTSRSPQGMYKREEVFDGNCGCIRSVLQRIQ